MSSNMSGKVFADNTGCVGWYRYCHDHDNKVSDDHYGTGIVIMIMSDVMIMIKMFVGMITMIVIMMFVVLVILMIMMFIVSEMPAVISQKITLSDTERLSLLILSKDKRIKSKKIIIWYMGTMFALNYLFLLTL